MPTARWRRLTAQMMWVYRLKRTDTTHMPLWLQRRLPMVPAKSAWAALRRRVNKGRAVKRRARRPKPFNVAKFRQRRAAYMREYRQRNRTPPDDTRGRTQPHTLTK